MNKDELTVKDAIQLAERDLREAGTGEACIEAEWIVAGALGMKRFELFMNPLQKLDKKERKRLDEILKRRKKREPLAYITGFTDFRGFIIKVSKAVLIPRPETEILVEEALSILNKGVGKQRVLEPCTGSGCVSVAIAGEFRAVKIAAIDISADAIKTARENAALNNVADKINFLRGDLLRPFKVRAAFDLIVANPPYIKALDMDGLAPEIRLYEPGLALYGGPDGLDYIKRLIKDSAVLLKPGGYLLLELGMGQAEKTRELARSTGLYENICIKKDLSRIERVFVAKKKLKS
jgi:release factor glutamine methyltransferase